MEKEADFLFTKKIVCPVCEEVFGVRTIKSASLRRLDPDFDLRPRFRYIDALKYEVYSCPNCGYTAMNRYFDNLTKYQKTLIRENICRNFEPVLKEVPETVDYMMAVKWFQLALKTSEAKGSKNSERAYIYLKISWLYRSLLEEMGEEDTPKKDAVKKEEEMYYRKAFEGFKEAVTSEDYPICGMDMHTMDYLLAALACNFKEYSYAAKAVGNILLSKTADHRMKDKALDLKERILEGIRQESGQQE